MWFWVLLIVVVILIAVLWSRGYMASVRNAITTITGGGGTNATKTVLLIPGLGNGCESYNWNLSTDEQRVKTGIPLAPSLQDAIANLGYHTICAEYDTPVDNLPAADIVIGHSIGGRVAQLIGETRSIPYIMLDPTPDYVYDGLAEKTKVTYTKVGEKYQRVRDFVAVMETLREQIEALPWRPAALIYSVDDNDPGKDAKDEYFENIDCSKTRLVNATHWVHITNQQAVLDAIATLKITKQ